MGFTTRCRVSIPPPLNGATARLMRRGEAYVRFPLNCHTPHIGPDCGTLAQFSAGQRFVVQLSRIQRHNATEPVHWGGFRLYTLRRAQPLSMCRHTGAGHSCHRFRLHDRRVPFPSPDPLGTLGLPGIVSFHSHLPHGGCDPPALISGLVRLCGI